eukprot:6394864-Alexandrium_andersonii.AAC.1
MRFCPSAVVPERPPNAPNAMRPRGDTVPTDGLLRGEVGPEVPMGPPSTRAKPLRWLCVWGPRGPPPRVAGRPRGQ